MAQGNLVYNWNSYLDLFPTKYRDVYFDEEYVKLYEDKESQAVCFVYQEGNKILLFPFLRRQFNLKGKIYFDFETAYGYGGPIINVTNDEAFHKKALNSFKDYCIQNKYVAGFVRFHPLLNNHKNFNYIGTTIFDRHTIAVDLSKKETDIWMNEIHSKNRNVIKKGVKSGLKFILDVEFNYLDDFIRLYDNTMDKVHAESFYYFKEDYYALFKLKIKNSFLGLVTKDDKIISGAIFFYSKDFGHYHLSGSDMEYLKYSPNNFMLYETAKVMKTIGVKKFHLGGGSDSNEQNTLYKFKKRFSKSLYDFYIGKLIFNQDVYDDLCNAWITDNPQKEERYKYHLLKYKY